VLAQLAEELRRHNPRLRIGFNPRKRRHELLLVRSVLGQPYSAPPCDYDQTGLKHRHLELIFPFVDAEGDPRPPELGDYWRLRARDTVNMTPQALCRGIEDHNDAVDAAKMAEAEGHLAECSEVAWAVRTGRRVIGYGD